MQEKDSDSVETPSNYSDKKSPSDDDDLEFGQESVDLTEEEYK